MNKPPMGYQAPVHENMDQHTSGIQPGLVFCTDLICWCHHDPRKLSAFGEALVQGLIPQALAGAYLDGVITPFPAEVNA